MCWTMSRRSTEYGHGHGHEHEHEYGDQDQVVSRSSIPHHPGTNHRLRGWTSQLHFSAILQEDTPSRRSWSEGARRVAYREDPASCHDLGKVLPKVYSS